MSAHSLLVIPKPRDAQDGYKDPTGPCGIARKLPTQPETSYQPGAKVSVQWQETINHPGCFVVDFAAANDSNFQVLGTKAHSGTDAPQNWSLDVTLPTTPCTGCTLRLRQLMLSADLPATACPPTTVAAGQTYYSCANVTIGGGGASGTGGASSSSGGTSAGGRGGAVGGSGTQASGGTGGGSAGAFATGGAPSTAAGAPAAAGASGIAPGNGGSAGATVAASGGASGGASKAGAPSGGAAPVASNPDDQQSSGCAVSAPGSSLPAGLCWLSALAMASVVRRRRNRKR